MITLPNLYYIQYFVDAVELGSLIASAEKNHISHSAVSRAITVLEDQLGYALMERKKRHFKMTQKGFEYAFQCRLILEQVSKFQNQNLTYEYGKIHIGLSRSLTKKYLAKIIKVIQTVLPGWKIECSFGTTFDLCHKVKEGKVDLALTVGMSNGMLIESELIETGKFVLVEKMNNYRQTSWPKKKFILTESRPETEKLKKNYKKQFQKDLEVFLEVQSWDVISELLDAEDGVALLPQINVDNMNAKKYKIHKTDWFDADYEIYLHQSKEAKNLATQLVIQKLMIELKL